VRELEILGDCHGCKVRAESAFCALSMESLTVLDQISYAVNYPENATLFTEDQGCRGVFLVCSGRAKVSTRSQDGRELMLRVAMAGEILGLSSVIANSPYRFSAVTLAPSTIRFVKREEFVNFLKSFPDTSLNALHALSLEYERVINSLRSLALVQTATARVAQLLLRTAPEDAGGGNVRLLLTQEQIAQMTATTRETVTRLLAQLRRERVIVLRGSRLEIIDRRALERLAS